MQRVPAKPNFVQLEQDVLNAWEAEDAFGVLRKKIAGKPLYRFIDGPITANNPMGVHHAWGRTLKDAFIRFNVMNGHDCRFQNGFDCQGLWVEVEVEKELGFQGKPDIEAFGLDRFADACKSRIQRFADVITDQSKRLGQWMDWEDSYYTHRDSNILGIWAFLKTCHDNGWIYRKGLPMPWCARCGTSLSEHEMAGSYVQMTHLSVYGQVPLIDDPSRRLLIWTTTPWTLSSNIAAAVHPDLDYIEVQADGWDYTLILCEGAKRILAGTGAKIVGRFKGAELVGQKYETFHPDFEAQQGRTHTVIPWDAVDAEEGSGIVHIAPGCGKEDHALGLELGLDAIVPIDENGIFKSGFGSLTGHAAADVPQQVADLLDAQNKLFKAEDYDHKYPVCWRCKDPLVFRLVDEWFIQCDEIRPRMKRAAAEVEWQPAFMGARMQNWLDNMGDWCISRKRYWGLPLPFYVCDDCDGVTVVGNLDELRAKAVDSAAVDALPELHRPWIDDVAVHCDHCQSETNRVVEVGDCWLDAGIVPYSTTGCWTNPEAFDRAYPTEWICEMREQVRLWFYSMLFMGVTLSDRSPYQRVLSYERVVSEDGAKFSKTGFMIRFDEAVEKMGADAMRWLYCRQPVTSDVRFGYGAGELAQRKLMGLWNVYGFYVTYALIDQPDAAAPLKPESLTVTDRWLLARLAHMVDVCTEGFSNYDSPAVVVEIESVLDDISNWYVRVNRRRFWRNDDPDDRAVAYGVLYRAIRTVSLVLAPIAPFITDQIWRNLIRSTEADAPASIHHASWPEAPQGWADSELLTRTETVRTTISLALNLRDGAGLRVRQPLARAFVVGDSAALDALREQEEHILSELNVKTLVLSDGTAGFMRSELGLDFRKAGPVLRKDSGKVKGLLAGLDAETHADLAQQWNTGTVHLPGWEGGLPSEIFVKNEVAQAGVEVASEGGLTVALDAALTPELEVEGWVRDLVRHIQVLRKDSGLDVSDRIQLHVALSDGVLADGFEVYREAVAEDVLAVQWLDEAPSGADAFQTSVRLGPHVADIGLIRHGQAT